MSEISIEKRMEVLEGAMSKLILEMKELKKIVNQSNLVFGVSDDRHRIDIADAVKSFKENCEECFDDSD